MCQNWSFFHCSERYHGKRPTPKTLQNWSQWKSTIPLRDGKKIPQFLSLTSALAGVRVSSGNVSRTYFPLQNVPQILRWMWGTLVPLIPGTKYQKAVSGMFSTLITLSLPSPEGSEMSTCSHKWTKSIIILCAWGLFPFSGFQTPCSNMTSPHFHLHSSHLDSAFLPHHLNGTFFWISWLASDIIIVPPCCHMDCCWHCTPCP